MSCDENHVYEVWQKLISLSPDEARDQWYKELLVCEGKKAARDFLKENEIVLAKKPTIVVSTLGHTPYGVAIFLYAVLSNLQRIQRTLPTVYLIVSEQSEEYANEIIIYLSTSLNIDSDIFHILEVNPGSVEDIYQKISSVELFTRGISVVDITGGTKAMSSALLGTAYTMSMFKSELATYVFYSYVPQEGKPKQRGYPAKPYTTKIKLQGTPIEIYRDYILSEALIKAREFDFDSAKQLLEKLKAYALKTETRSYADALLDIVNILEDLAYFNLSPKGFTSLKNDIGSIDTYKYLREKLGVNFSVSVLDDLISRIKRIGKMLKGNDPLKNCRGDRNECARDMLFLAYLLYLTGLAWEKKFPALSTQIYYRAIEMALQSYLLSKGLWTGGKTPLKELEKLDLPESLFKEFANRARKDREEEEEVQSIKLGLKDNAKIINALAGGFPNFEKLDDYTQARNTSILAHGLYRPRPGDKLFGMLRRYVPCVLGYIAELLSTNFDMLREEAQPIEIILGVKRQILHAEMTPCN